MSQLDLTLPQPIERFDGATYDAQQDCARLTGQLKRVYMAMRDGRWVCLHWLSQECQCSEASASARIRDLRKAKFGAHEIERRRSPLVPGMWEYRMAA